MSITLLTEDQALEIAQRAASLAIEATLINLNIPPEVMTLPQLCQYLNTTAPTIRANIKKKRLPVSCALGGSTPRFIKVDVDEWLKSN